MEEQAEPLCLEVEMTDSIESYDSSSSRWGSVSSKSSSFILDIRAAFQAVVTSTPHLPKFEWESSVTSESPTPTNLKESIDALYPALSLGYYIPTGSSQNATGTSTSSSSAQSHVYNFGVYQPTGSPQASSRQSQYASTEASEERGTESAHQHQTRIVGAPASPHTPTHFTFREEVPFERLPGDHEPPRSIESITSRKDSHFAVAAAKTLQQSHPRASVVDDEMDLQPEIITVIPRRPVPNARFEPTERYGPSNRSIESLLDRTIGWKEAQTASQRRKSSSAFSFTRWASVKTFTHDVVRSLSKRNTESQPKPRKMENDNDHRDGERREGSWRSRFKRLKQSSGSGRRRLKKRHVGGGQVRRVYGGERMVISDETVESPGSRREIESVASMEGMYV
ncbi:hypothetical protein FB567DRAFT_612074 [Paraphoma chrysanthemicola]|uniref:Uncharacterized protein n=1 Tax=Paraphoma chrysanthemicola TaxID=798071 RepID=A0A8K0QUB5_9PLEO|nr:hypothetical protein FB567DRAFT_612074 [Paraphoma chrysanthemicola]